jgi:hypothetical protein
LIADLEGEITGAQFAGEARMIIAGMVNSQTVLLTVAAEPQPCGVQVVEWVGLVHLLLIRGKPDGSIIGIPEGEGWLPAFDPGNGLVFDPGNGLVSSYGLI